MPATQEQKDRQQVGESRHLLACRVEKAAVTNWGVGRCGLEALALRQADSGTFLSVLILPNHINTCTQQVTILQGMKSKDEYSQH